jgi:hypothetical protein
VNARVAQSAILWPMCAMAALTFVVMLGIPKRRFC